MELQRVEIQRHLTLCLARAEASRDEVLALVVVLVNNREIMNVFPPGRLPEDPLKPKQVYETGQGSKRRVRYTTTYRWGDGERFAEFAREPEWSLRLNLYPPCDLSRQDPVILHEF